MNKRFILLLVLLVGLGSAWCLWRWHASRPQSLKTSSIPSESSARTGTASRSDKPSPTEIVTSPRTGSLPPVGVKPPDSEADKRYLDRIAPIFQRPLVFHGLVLDERNTPVPAAKARFSLTNNPDPNGMGTRGEILSDPAGRFVIGGRGMGIFVEVSKEGYYRVPELAGKRGSSGAFRNRDNLGDTDVPMPTEGSPAIFVLQKMGEAVPLVHIGPRSIIVPKDGTPTEIDLGTGRAVAAGTGQVRVEVWTQNQGMNPNKGEHYDWRCRLTIPGGGLVERTGSFCFEAPESGYQPTFEAGMARTAEHWRNGLERTFFAQIADGRFARFSLALTTGGEHFIVLESFLNPKAGSRNLEFDPAKAITPKP